MSSFESNEAAFDACKNNVVRKRFATPTQLVCARYPEGGAQVHLNYAGNLLLDQVASEEPRTVAQALGCISCPYAEDRFAFSVTESRDDNNRVVTTTEFVPVLEVALE